ncbi:MAG TPA: hypothetical protein VNL17_14545 [Verrucomicrobiae bacterium]|nr:hypothetical protein [Verrucomicrobiae bacterium]
MSARPRQNDCQHEPPYPDHDCVVFSIRSPEMTAHLASHRCAIEEPHSVAVCGEWCRTADDPQGVSEADAKYTCPVCLFPAMPHEPAPLSEHICPCCGTQFGYDDAMESHAELRERWKAAGCPWHSKRMKAPDGWDPKVQLAAAS